MPQKPHQRRWYEANRERQLAKASAHQAANHEAYLAYQRQHYAKHAEARREQSRQWRLENGDNIVRTADDTIANTHGRFPTN